MEDLVYFGVIPPDFAQAAQVTFSKILQDTVSEVRPKFIAEESSEEALDGVFEASIAREIAIEHGIQHKFCDPTNVERLQIGYESYDSILPMIKMHNDERLSRTELCRKAHAIDIGRYFEIRERFWLDRLSECPDGDGVFICGDAHVEGFTRLLDASQIGWTVVARGIGFAPGEEADIQENMRYLRDHPELACWEKFTVPNSLSH